MDARVVKISLVTTTINIPKVLSLYRALGPDAMFHIVGDRKTPDEKVVDFLLDIPNHAYYGADLLNDYKCAKFIGHNSIQRRNLGYLEAFKWGAEIVVTVDDDNAPLNDRYFDDFILKFVAWDRSTWGLGRQLGPCETPHSFSGLQVTSAHGWFDPGQLLIPQARHRGYPHDARTDFEVTHVVGAKIGVAAGLCLGNPDISAVDRISRGPIVHSVSELARAGVVCDRNVHTVFNSQNTAFIREIAPAMFLWPGVGRYDDIYASLIAQRIMRERELYVYFGQPFVYQERNLHNLLKDLRAEIDGMENIRKLAGFLGSVVLKPGSVIEQTRQLFEAFDSVPKSFDIMPKESVKAGLAWLEDCESVL